MSDTQRQGPDSGRIDTWTSGADAPAVPRSGDGSKLVEAVERSAPDRSVVLRVTLETGSEDAKTAMKEHLLDSDPVLGTSIGRSDGPAAPDTCEVVVAPGEDLAAVGRTSSDVDGVAGVSAAAFRDGGAGGGRDADDGGADGPIDVTRDAIYAPLAVLPDVSAVRSYAEVVADVATGYLGREASASASGADAANGHRSGDPPHPRYHAGTPSTGGEWAAVVERLEELSERVGAMELRLSEIDRRTARHDEGTALAPARATTVGSSPTTDGAGEGVDGELRERLDGIETALAAVDRRQRRLEAARLADPP